MKAGTDMRCKVFPGVLLVAALTCILPCPQAHATGLDSMRVVIRDLQNEIDAFQTVIDGLSDQFNDINHRIYEYKAGGQAGNIFSRNRMQNALKTSHLFADSLDALNGRLRDRNQRLQQAYSAAIRQIDLLIQGDLALVKTSPSLLAGSKKKLAEIKDLEREKSEYARRLQTLEVDEQGWKNIGIEEDDTVRRLRRKSALLEDFLRNAQRVLGYLDADILKRESDRKTYSELLDFYREMGESLDDDQDIFDRTRLEEIADKIENLDNETANIRERRRAVVADVVEIEAKLERFRQAIEEQGAK